MSSPKYYTTSRSSGKLIPDYSPRWIEIDEKRIADKARGISLITYNTEIIQESGINKIFSSMPEEFLIAYKTPENVEQAILSKISEVKLGTGLGSNLTSKSYKIIENVLKIMYNFSGKYDDNMGSSYLFSIYTSNEDERGIIFDYLENKGLIEWKRIN